MLEVVDVASVDGLLDAHEVLVRSRVEALRDTGDARPGARRASTAPSPDPPGSSWWDALRGFTHRFLAYTSSTCSPDPRPSGSAGHAPALAGPLATLPGTPGSGCPQLHQPAATGWRRRSPTSTRPTSALRRTRRYPHPGF